MNIFRYKWVKVGMVVLLVLGLIVVASINRPQTITITIHSDKQVEMAIYRGGEDDSHGHATEPVGEVVEKINKSTTVTLWPGKYILQSSLDILKDESVSFNVPDDSSLDIYPELTNKELLAVKKKEEKSIKEAVFNTLSINSSKGFHFISSVRIYGTGEWASVDMHTTSNADLFHTVLKKEGGSWKVKTDPEMVLSTKKYRNIPRYILVDTNSHVYEQTGYRE